jgi:hypothetical protein
VISCIVYLLRVFKMFHGLMNNRVIYMPCLFMSHIDRWIYEDADTTEQTFTYGTLHTAIDSRMWNSAVLRFTIRMNWPCVRRQVQVSSVQVAACWTGSKYRRTAGGTSVQDDTATRRYCYRAILLQVTATDWRPQTGTAIFTPCPLNKIISVK